MKLPVTAETPHRWASAVLRNCLTHALAPIACPVRKCRRDGVCSGPLVACEGDSARLAPADGTGLLPEAGQSADASLSPDSSLSPDAGLGPVCVFTLDETLRASVFSACAAHCRELLATPGATVTETTRVIASRRWRRLTGLEA